jgi:hypothetical protein
MPGKGVPHRLTVSVNGARFTLPEGLSSRPDLFACLLVLYAAPTLRHKKWVSMKELLTPY